MGRVPAWPDSQDLKLARGPSACLPTRGDTAGGMNDWLRATARWIIMAMSWPSVSATVLPLAGVILGSASTLVVQYLALRGGARRDAAQRAAEQRAERKEAIIGFLSAAERIEHQRGQLAARDDRDLEQITEQMHAVWLAKKIIELVCSGDVAQAAHDYTRELNSGGVRAHLKFPRPAH
jgi:hypothetical protein